MNPDLNKLQAYPFEKLARLNAGIVTPADLKPISLSIGEPKHPTPSFITQAVTAELSHLATYPTTKGIDRLRESIANWCTRRFQLRAGTLTAAQHVLPVNGTREALFSFTQAVIDRSQQPLVVSPNPFYQIYEGAALLAGARIHYLPCTASMDWQPDYDEVPDAVWQQCQILFVCSPGNPTGAVTSLDTLKKLIQLADKHDFVIAADECYSEIYPDESTPPAGLLQACAQLGRDDYRRCVVFHSLSKRSNVPGMRSGFVAGDASLLKPYLTYRTYHGCAMPIQHQHASALAWADETHVRDNREAYRAKFDAVLPILQQTLRVERTEASFYLWPQTPIDDTLFARDLLAQKNVAVVPGSYLSREMNGINPGANHVRLALVAPLDDCIEAAKRIRDFAQLL